ncbi:Tmem81 [Columba livia]|nr:Tmem81 [Columba livia]
MTMKTLGNGHILGALLGVFYLPSVVCYDWVTIPAALASAPARLAVNSTSCSVTCGLGFKQEESCEVTPAGERKDCVMRTSRCLTRWFCGLLHFTIPVGKPFQLTCQPSDTADFDRQAYGYVWKFAQGLITTENVLFKRLQENDTVLSREHVLLSLSIITIFSSLGVSISVVSPLHSSAILNARPVLVLVLQWEVK